WKQVGSHLQATVITTAPNADMGGVHDRMPVILSPDAWIDWLSTTPLSDNLRRSLLSPSTDGTLSRWPVGRGVGSIRNDYPGLIDPVEPPAIPQELF
ncbi:MAG: SOS response-associated peptidase family protein, partial [bacterium]